MSTDIQALRDTLRSATLGSSVFKKELIKFKDHEFEIRELSAGAKEKVRKKAGVKIDKDGNIELDQSRYTAYALVESVFVPGTETKVFDYTDIDAIVNAPESGFYSVLGKATMKMLNGDEEKPEGNSETPAES